MLHQAPEYQGALFQVASQFNCLEMIEPSVTPEDGVTRYEHDRTQGPACALAAGAALLYRTFFVPVGDQRGQTTTSQLDGLADVGAALSRALGRPPIALWEMRNGYALCTRSGLDAIAHYLAAARAEDVDAVARALRIGMHRNVEVTDAPAHPGPLVSQAFCAALPVAYGHVPQRYWQAFAQLILAAAYEATLLEGVLNAQRGASNIVLLTLLGSGAFGNALPWIEAAITQALTRVGHVALDVRLVSHGTPSKALRDMVSRFQRHVITSP
jgi:hypothetical protein